MWGYDSVQLIWLALSSLLSSLSLIHKNMILLWNANMQRNKASQRGGYNPWKCNFLIQSILFFLCNNSSNEKENEITSLSSCSMKSILGHMLLSPHRGSFRPSHAHVSIHILCYKCHAGVSMTVDELLRKRTLLRLSLMYSKLRTSIESPPLTKAMPGVSSGSDQSEWCSKSNPWPLHIK